MSEIRYCSNCGSDRIVSEIPDGDTIIRFVCKNCGNIHYINPRIVVGCLPVFENKILLCRRAIEPCMGTWNLPAGYMENNERVEDGAIRETAEEANASVEIIRLHCVYSIPHVNQVYLIFLSRLKNLDFTPGDETSEVKLFEIDHIPWDDIGFTSTKYAIRKYLEDLSRPGVLTHLGYYQS